MATKIVIFDFDGTLGDTRRKIIITFQRTMQERGLEVMSEEVCASTIGLTLGDGFKAMYPTLSDSEAEECVEHYRRVFFEDIDSTTPELFDGVKEALARLSAMDLKLTIASSRSSPSLKLFLKNMGIADYFSYIVAADTVAKHKPDPEPVLQTLRECGYKPEEAIVVGDMPVDVLMARHAGVRSVGVTWGNAQREELETAGADYVIDHISELFDCL